MRVIWVFLSRNLLFIVFLTFFICHRLFDENKEYIHNILLTILYKVYVFVRCHVKAEFSILYTEIPSRDALKSISYNNKENKTA